MLSCFSIIFFFFFNDTATTEIYTLSLHDALPIADSAALMADSVDMLGDGLVYGISLYALERSLRWRAGMALIKAGFILTLGLGVIIDIALKVVWGGPPASGLMLVFGTMALVAN